MKMRALHLTDLFMIGAVVYGGLMLVPGTLWFEPKKVFIDNSTIDKPPSMTVEREIKITSDIKYSVVLRQIGKAQAICDAGAGPFTYNKTRGPLEDIDWTWWTGADASCWPVAPGSYVSDTCWTIVQPLWGLLPPKTVCITSNVFTITAISPEEAEEAISATRSLKQQVQELQQELQEVEQQTKELTNDEDK